MSFRKSASLTCTLLFRLSRNFFFCSRKPWYVRGVEVGNGVSVGPGGGVIVGVVGVIVPVGVGVRVRVGVIVGVRVGVPVKVAVGEGPSVGVGVARWYPNSFSISSSISSALATMFLFAASWRASSSSIRFSNV